MMIDPHPRRQATPQARALSRELRSNFLAGLIIVAPIGMTIWLIWTVVGWVDSWVWPFVPQAYQPTALLNDLLGRGPENQIDVNVRGVGCRDLPDLHHSGRLGW